MDCIFCQIVEKKIPCTFVHEDDKVVAFADIQPQAPIHQLIIPRQHISTLDEVEEKDISVLGHMMSVAQMLARKANIAIPGYRVVMNCNANGGQAVFHIHLHLLGGRALTWPPG